MVLYLHHPSSLEYDPSVLSPDHPDTPARIAAIDAAMAAIGWPGCDRVAAPEARESELELVHAASHVQSIRRLCLAGGGQIDDDTYVGEQSYHAALHAAGGACTMVRALTAGEAGTAFSGMRPSGHHAEHDGAMGCGSLLDAASFAQLACQVRDMSILVGAPLGAVLEGGYDPGALADCVVATIAALNGEGEAESIAPDPIVTSRVAAHVGHYWGL